MATILVKFCDKIANIVGFSFQRRPWPFGFRGRTTSATLHKTSDLGVSPERAMKMYVAQQCYLDGCSMFLQDFMAKIRFLHILASFLESKKAQNWNGLQCIVLGLKIWSFLGTPKTTLQLLSERQSPNIFLLKKSWAYKKMFMVYSLLKEKIKYT